MKFYYNKNTPVLFALIILLFTPSALNLSSDASAQIPPFQITLSSDSIKYGEEVIITADVSEGISGTAIFYWSLDGSTYHQFDNRTVAYQDPAIFPWKPEVSGNLTVGATLTLSTLSSKNQIDSNLESLQVLNSIELNLDISDPIITVGERITLSSVTDTPGIGTVIFQFSKDNSDWFDLGVDNSPDGESYELDWISNALGTIYFRSYYAGDTNYPKTYSNSVTAIVTEGQSTPTSLSLKASSSEIKLGQKVTLTIESSPSDISSVAIQTSKDKTKWTDIGTVYLDASGYGQFSLIPDFPDTKYFRAHYQGNEDYSESYSAVKQVTVSIESLSIQLTKGSIVAGEEAELLVLFSPESSVSVSIIDPSGKLVAAGSISTDDLGKGRFYFGTDDSSRIGLYLARVVNQNSDRNEANSTSFRVIEGEPDPAYDPNLFLQKEPDFTRNYVSGEILITVKDIDPNSSQITDLVEEVNGRVIEIVKEIGALRVAVPEDTEQYAIDRIREDGSNFIRFVGLNKYLVPTEINMTAINDPDFPRQIKHYELIELPSAWNFSVGDPSIIVAVIDSGIEYSHTDLEENVWKNDDDCEDGIDNDSNGYVDDCMGWNFSNAHNYGLNSNISDESGSWPLCNGHGTHVSGIVASVNNGVGGLGVAPNVKIMPVKISGNENVDGVTMCVSTELKAAQGIVYATDNGARILNLSFGCGNGEKCERVSDSPLESSFKYAHSKGVLLVAAAGNERQTSEGTNDWHDYSEYLLEVSSVGLDSSLASYSNFGNGVKLSAPGTTVYSTKIGGIYGLKTGTSQATPMVTGCAALILSMNNSLANNDIQTILTASAKDIGEAGQDNEFGYGLLDCNNAMQVMSTLDVTQDEYEVLENPSVDHIATSNSDIVTSESEKGGFSEPISGGQNSQCLIATAAFGSELTPQVQFLRDFRDNRILTTLSGSSFMNVFNTWYYSFSPYVADYERDQPWLQEIVKVSIYPLLGILQVSEIGYSVVQGEHGAVISGAISGALIGAVYFSPFGLVINKYSRGQKLDLKTIIAILSGVSVFLVISIMVSNQSMLMVSTSLFIITILSFSSIISAYAIAKTAKKVGSVLLKQRK